ncbi:HSP18 transcriptional regulator [Streptomyces sp. NPDC005181]|uniref:HSP18 transcriptional regulator n=1 Tax=Streptomyces sp. NPDC005181 TaxID=3156869 RepID=UPI0033AA307F
MPTAAQRDPSRDRDRDPDTGAVPFLAAAAALEAIDAAVRGACTADEAPPSSRAEREQVLASLLLLREVREQLAGWETSLIESAREAGASWAELAGPLGVASRQAAERRYLRLRPGADGTTGEQRVKATRDRRAADRTITAWARTHAADLRTLAGQITALTDLPDAAHTCLGHLRQALADDDPARLVAPLAATRPHLKAHHRDLADRIDSITHHTGQLRQKATIRRQDA